MILQLFFFARSIALWFSQQKGRGVDHPKKNRTMQKPNLGMVNFAVLLLETPNMLLMVESLPPLCWLLNPSSLSPNVATSQDPEKHQFDESNLPTANSWHGHGLYMCNSVKSWIMYPYWGMVTNLSININIPISSHFNEDSHHGMDDHKDILARIPESYCFFLMIIADYWRLLVIIASFPSTIN
jgi:hypothetical protein